MPDFKGSAGELRKFLEANRCKHLQQEQITALCPRCGTRQKLIIEVDKGSCPECGEINIEEITR